MLGIYFFVSAECVGDFRQSSPSCVATCGSVDCRNLQLPFARFARCVACLSLFVLASAFTAVSRMSRQLHKGDVAGSRFKFDLGAGKRFSCCKASLCGVRVAATLRWLILQAVMKCKSLGASVHPA